MHTARSWALGRAKYLTNCWNMEQFFRVTHVDINAALYALNQLKVCGKAQKIYKTGKVVFLMGQNPYVKNCHSN